MSAWKVIPYGALVSLVEAVRNRILSFVLEIEAEAPDAGEAGPNSRPLPQERVAQVFNTYISGNVQNVATASSNVTQTADFQIKAGDFDSLARYLSTMHVERNDIEKLRQAIETDTKGDHRSLV